MNASEIKEVVKDVKEVVKEKDKKNESDKLEKSKNQSIIDDNPLNKNLTFGLKSKDNDSLSKANEKVDKPDGSVFSKDNTKLQASKNLLDGNKTTTSAFGSLKPDCANIGGSLFGNTNNSSGSMFSLNTQAIGDKPKDPRVPKDQSKDQSKDQPKDHPKETSLFGGLNLGGELDKNKKPDEAKPKESIFSNKPSDNTNTSLTKNNESLGALCDDHPAPELKLNNDSIGTLSNKTNTNPTTVIKAKPEFKPPSLFASPTTINNNTTTTNNNTTNNAPMSNLFINTNQNNDKITDVFKVGFGEKPKLGAASNFNAYQV